ncbi:hypothetical protein M5689_012985 [Euphorbia peplus]|nr:hypothetical protein M5689_012985 [Euphorbia peplus]
MGTDLASRSCWNSSRGRTVEENKEMPANSGGQRCVPACRKLDGVATWILNGVVAVFFSSLERCSCIYLDTKDDYEDSNYLPLIPNLRYEKKVAALNM